MRLPAAPRIRLADGPARVASVLGGLLLAAALCLEVSDTAPHAELAVAIVSGLLLALATLRRPGSELGVVLRVSAAGALLLAAAKGALVGEGLIALVLAGPTAALSVTALLAAVGAARSARAAVDEQRRARLEGEERERARWARDLHDDTLQELGALQVMLAGAQRMTDAGQRERALREASGLLCGQIATLRHLVAELRPLALDQLGLGPSLTTLGRRTAELHGLQVDVEVDLDVETAAGGGPGATEGLRLPAPVEVAAYRVVQESLRNIVRHAGATRVLVQVQQEAGRLRVLVRDDGWGLPAELPDAGAGHFGVRGMRERVELAGGSFRLGRDSRGGTRVDVVLPLPTAPVPPATGPVGQLRRGSALPAAPG